MAYTTSGTRRVKFFGLCDHSCAPRPDLRPIAGSRRASVDSAIAGLSDGRSALSHNISLKENGFALSDKDRANH
jgi:hypothetical protein